MVRANACYPRLETVPSRLPTLVVAVRSAAEDRHRVVDVADVVCVVRNVPAFPAAPPARPTPYVLHA